jgi:hypothetical protein
MGYTKNEYGKVIVQEEEAEIVQFIYEAFLEGANFTEIAKFLSESNVPTPMGNQVWRATTVKNILGNEKYCGDVIMQKTFTVDCFSHKKRKNNGEVNKYKISNGIPAIIPKNKWKMVQHLLKTPTERKVKRSPLLLEKKPSKIRKCKSGVLRGFIMYDPNWTEEEIYQVIRSGGIE